MIFNEQAFEIVYILLGKEKITAKELAERFEVSQRTIYGILRRSVLPVFLCTPRRARAEGSVCCPVLP